MGTATHTYSYTDENWGDLLTAYDGVSISHDAIGNPLTDGTWTYTWEHGRELAAMSGGGTTWSFTYDANGMRTQRTNGSTTYEYVYNGSQLSQMTVAGQTLRFTYGTDGSPTSVSYGTSRYFYVKNLQGDVMALVSVNGIKVVEYTYDAWGNILTTTGSMASTLGAHTPLRYRGYVFDQETELYYLQSRYYDPQVGRFINADSYVSTGQGLMGNNMFAYCNNNPVTLFDPTGESGLAIGIFIGVSAIIGGIAGAFTAATTGSNVLEGALEGAALGAVAATATIVMPLLMPTASATITAAATFGVAAVGGALVDVAAQRISHEFSEEADEEFVADPWRCAKTALTTGIAGVVPTYGNPGKSVVNAIGSLIIGGDASFVNAAIEVAITNLIK